MLSISPISRAFVAQNKDSSSEVDLALFGNGTFLVGELKARPKDPSYADIAEIIELANSFVAQNVSNRVLLALSREGPIGESAPSAIHSLPPISKALPPKPTVEQAIDFFKRIAGTWELDYVFGKEEALIDSTGNYICSGKTQQGNHYKNNLRLVLLASNQDFSKIEI